MTQRRLLLIVILWTLAFLTGSLFYTKFNKKANHANVAIEDKFFGKKFDIKRIKVLQGDFFDITLFEQDQRILGKLPVFAVEESKEKVLDLVHHSKSPKVLIRSKGKEGQVVVDLFFLSGGEEISLVEWLEKNNLIYHDSGS